MDEKVCFSLTHSTIAIEKNRWEGVCVCVLALTRVNLYTASLLQAVVYFEEIIFIWALIMGPVNRCVCVVFFVFFY